MLTAGGDINTPSELNIRRASVSSKQSTLMIPIKKGRAPEIPV
jgi:hypothetical protein